MNSSFVVLLLRGTIDMNSSFVCVCKKKRGTIDMNSSFVVYVRRREGQ